MSHQTNTENYVKMKSHDAQFLDKHAMFALMHTMQSDVW